MTLQSSGQISLNDVNVELGNSGTATINMNSSDVRDLFGVSSGEIKLSDGYGASNTAWYGSRGLFSGGNYATKNNIEYITIASTGNSTDFGDLSQKRADHAGASDGSRCVFGGGADYGPFSASSYGLTSIEYVTASTTGNASSFGSLSSGRSTRSIAIAAVSDGSRGVFSGGQNRGGYREFTYVMDYITIGSTGNASDFGDLLSISPSNEFWNAQAGASNSTRGVFAGGGWYTATNVMQYITIQSTGNATDFGDLIRIKSYFAGTNGGDRGVYMGGYYDGVGTYDDIDYIDITTTGNASDFGTISSGSLYGIDACSDNSRGVFGGYGATDMSYITISTTGNSSTFGNLGYGQTFGLASTSGT